MGYGIWDMGYGIWDMGYGIWDMGYGIWDMGYGIWDMAFKFTLITTSLSRCFLYLKRVNFRFSCYPEQSEGSRYCPSVPGIILYTRFANGCQTFFK